MEVVLALGLLALVALVIIGVFLSLFQATTKSRELATAELLMESVLEKVTATGPPSWGVSVLGAKIAAPQSDELTDFFYQVDTQKLSDDTITGELWEVAVTVAWWTEESNPLKESRINYGNTFVSGTRSVFYGQR